MKLLDIPIWMREKGTHQSITEINQSKDSEPVVEKIKEDEPVKIVNKVIKPKQKIIKYESSEDISDDYIEPKKIVRKDKNKMKKIEISESDISTDSEESDYDTRIKETKNLKKYFKEKKTKLIFFYEFFFSHSILRKSKKQNG